MEDGQIKTDIEKRLSEIEKDISLLISKKEKLEKRWRLEKNVIKEIRGTKANIEKAKTEADLYEREGNLAKVAELRYGTLHELEKKLINTNIKIKDIQKDGKLLTEEVSAEVIAEIVAKWTGIPVQKMIESEKNKLLLMEKRIHQRVISQEEAVSAVSNAIRRSRSGLQDAKRPIGSFIFLGTTGVGKTEMARALAEFLFDDENALIRMDMSEYMEKFSVTRLIGAPPGYVGYEEGGQLTEAVRNKPYSVLLLDEIEKAHKDVFNILLQVLDEGRLTDGKGRTVDFKNTIIIMTSNLGTEIIQENLFDKNEDESNTEEVKLKIIELLKKNMRPEFLNRIDEIVLFKPLGKKEIFQISELQFGLLAERLSKLGISANISDKAKVLLSELGYDFQYGARPLKRAVQKFISDPLSIELISGRFVSGDKILIDADKNRKFLFKKYINSTK